MDLVALVEQQVGGQRASSSGVDVGAEWMYGARRMDRIALLKALERAAAVVRRAGLGVAVDRIREVALPALGRFTVEVDALQLSGDTGEHSSYVRELLDEDRESYTVECFRAAVHPGATVLDVGAHLGFFTLQAARAAGAEGRVVAVEPNPRTLGHLRRNLALNGVQERVRIVPAAVGAASGTTRFYVEPAGDTSSRFRPAPAAEEVEVELTTADALMAGLPPVDVVKIDVEGGELEALAGMEATLARAAADVSLFAELNPEALARAGATPADLLARLEALGLESRAIDERARNLVAPDDPALAGARYVNLLCRRRAR